jgi:hypothetical protein
MLRKNGINIVEWICKIFHWQSNTFVKNYTIMNNRNVLRRIVSMISLLIHYISIYSDMNNSQITLSKNIKSTKNQ